MKEKCRARFPVTYCDSRGLDFYGKRNCITSVKTLKDCVHTYFHILCSTWIESPWMSSTACRSIEREPSGIVNIQLFPWPTNMLISCNLFMKLIESLLCMVRYQYSLQTLCNLARYVFVKIHSNKISSQVPQFHPLFSISTVPHYPNQL